jgi:hypothetical protein
MPRSNVDNQGGDRGEQNGAAAPPELGQDFLQIELGERSQSDGNIAAADDCRSELARRFEHSALDRLLGSVNERF